MRSRAAAPSYTTSTAMASRRSPVATASASSCSSSTTSTRTSLVLPVSARAASEGHARAGFVLGVCLHPALFGHKSAVRRVGGGRGADEGPVREPGMKDFLPGLRFPLKGAGGGPFIPRDHALLVPQ